MSLTAIGRYGAFLLALVLAGCATTQPTGPASRADLEARIALNPNDTEAHRELGVLLAAERNYPGANQALQRAYERAPDDPRTLYHLGLVNEVLGREPTALRLYEQYPSVPASSEYREMMRGRYQWLLRRQVRQEFREQMAREEEIAPTATGDALGVLPLEFRSGASRFEPLGRGLAELISGDLASVQGLTVVERVRLHVLLGELELARTGAVDPETAPRYGRLLRANRLVGGQYGVVNDQLTVDAGVFSATEPDDLPELSSTSGSIDRLFDIQKEVTLALLGKLGITPTTDQLARIERAPTRNLDAFVTFSRGLQLEDREEYGRAAALYQEAFNMDPNFAEAGRKAAECRAIESQLGEPGDRLAAVAVDENALLAGRSDRLNKTLSNNFIPGIETRHPAIEGAQGGLLGTLPEPPPPPAGGN